jgi:hypothetical protein
MVGNLVVSRSIAGKDSKVLYRVERMNVRDCEEVDVDFEYCV